MKTGRSKCFAVLKMESQDVVDSILKQPKHVIGGFAAYVREFRPEYEQRQRLRSMNNSKENQLSSEVENDLPLD